MAIQHKGLGRVSNATDPGVPEGLAARCVMRDEVAGAIAGEQQTARGGEQSARAAAVRIIGMPPGNLARLVIDRGEERAAGTDVDLLFTTQAHRAAGIEVRE